MRERRRHSGDHAHRRGRGDRASGRARTRRRRLRREAVLATEIVARVRAVLRRRRRSRSRGAAGARSGRSRSTARSRVSQRQAGGADAEGVRPARLLRRQPRTAFSRARLLDELWDVAYAGDPSTVTVPRPPAAREDRARSLEATAPGHRLGRRIPVRAMSGGRPRQSWSRAPCRRSGRWRPWRSPRPLGAGRSAPALMIVIAVP